MTLAIFDLDNTLLGGDSDTSWGEFLCRQGHVDQADHARMHDKYYQDYLAGTLDILEFLRFQLHILGQHDMETLYQWRDQYLEEMITPLLLPRARELVEQHRDLGHQLLIITATNRFITEPVARMFGIDELIATEPEISDGRYTGNVTGTPSFAHGKVIRLQEWLVGKDETLKGSWFYSDSHNDIPLLELVENPVAVDPDKTLKNEALKRSWKIISLRD